MRLCEVFPRLYSLETEKSCLVIDRLAICELVCLTCGLADAICLFGKLILWEIYLVC